MSFTAILRQCLFICLTIFSFSYDVSYAGEATCSTQEACAEEDALRAALKSKNKAEFQKAFRSLQNKEHSKLYSEIRKLTFDNTAEDAARALMVAQVIANERRKISPTPETYKYWRHWYEQTKSANVEHIIPTYMLFNFHEEIANKVAITEKRISDNQKYLKSTLKNPHGRPDYLSEEALTKKIEQGKTNLAPLPALLEPTTTAFVKNETAVLGEYFLIFDVIRQTDNYSYGYQLPFPRVLETSIQTKTLWVEEFSHRLKCGLTDDRYAVMTQIAELDSNNARLKSCLKKKLTYTDKMPLINGTLSFIYRYDDLRTDRNLHEAVSAIDENHPFTSTRLTRQQILSNTVSSEIDGEISNRYSTAYRKLFSDLNANRTYCDADPVMDFDYVETPSEFSRPRTQENFQRGLPVMTVKTPSGYLTGHDRGEFGGGLLYWASESNEPEILSERNMIAIINSDEPGVYWGVYGLNHLAPGTGTILRIDARTDDVSIETHMRMPIVTRNVKLLENGNLFMDFWRRSYTSYKDGEEIVTSNPSSRYNPPVILSRAGEITAACGD